MKFLYFALHTLLVKGNKTKGIKINRKIYNDTLINTTINIYIHIETIRKHRENQENEDERMTKVYRSECTQGPSQKSPI